MATTNCPKCGASLQEGARFCDKCGAKVGAEGAVEVTVPAWAPVVEVAAKTAPAPAQGQFSADGRWWWSGMQWVPVPVPVATAAVKVKKPAKRKTARLLVAGTLLMMMGAFLVAPPFVLGTQGISQGEIVVVVGLGVIFMLLGLLEIALAIGKRRWRRTGWVGAVAAVGVASTGLGALAFWALPVLSLRAGVVVVASVAAILAILALAGLGLWQGVKGTRKKALLAALTMVGLLALQGLAAGGLNNYADSRMAPSAALVQDAYVQVAVAVEQGNELADGYSPTGVTYPVVMNEAQAAEEMLMRLDVPGGLANYKERVQAWATSVGDAAAIAADGGKAKWKAPSIGSFQLALSADQANAAATTATQEIATLLQYGDYAFATSDWQGLLWVGAGLDMENYWLTGIGAAADPSWLAAHLRFVELGANSTSKQAVAAAGLEVQLVAYHPGAVQGGLQCVWLGRYSHCTDLSALQTPLTSLVRAAFLGTRKGAGHCALCGTNSTAGTTYTPAQQWSATAKPFKELLPETLMPLTPSTPANTGGPQAPAEIVNACTAGVGTIYGKDLNVPAVINLNRVPPNGGGWICLGYLGSNCWTFTTYTGWFYKGGDGCVESENLLPVPPLQAAAGELASIGSLLGGLIPSGSNSTSSGWDGSYNMTPPPNTPAHDGPNGHWYYGPWDCIGGQYMTQQGGSWAYEFPSMVVVSSNSVAAHFGTLSVNLPIDSTGQAQYLVTGTSLRYSFSSAGGVTQVSVTIMYGSTVGPPPSPVSGGGVYSHGFGSCTATYSGTRG